MKTANRGGKSSVDMKKKGGREEFTQPSPPKKPLSSYFMFQNDMRDKFQRQNPDVGGRDILKQVSEAWKSLPEKERRKYEDKAEQAKRDYEDLVREFESKWGAIQQKKRKGDEGKESAGKSKKAKTNEEREVMEVETPAARRGKRSRSRSQAAKERPRDEFGRFLPEQEEEERERYRDRDRDRDRDRERERDRDRDRERERDRDRDREREREREDRDRDRERAEYRGGKTREGSEKLSRLAQERPRDESGKFRPEHEEERYGERKRYRTPSREREHHAAYRGGKTPEGSEKLSRLAHERPRDEHGKFRPEHEEERYGERRRYRTPSREREHHAAYRGGKTPEGSEKLSRLAQERPRDEQGRFRPEHEEGQYRGQERERRYRTPSREREHHAAYRGGKTPEGAEKLSRLAHERPRDEQGRFRPEHEEEEGQYRRRYRTPSREREHHAAYRGGKTPEGAEKLSRLAQERPRDEQGRFRPEHEEGQYRGQERERRGYGEEREFGRGEREYGREQEREFGRGQERGGLGFYDLRDRERHLIGGVGGIYGSMGEYEKKYHYGRPREEDPFEKLSRLAHERPRDEHGRFISEGGRDQGRGRSRSRSRSRERERFQERDYGRGQERFYGDQERYFGRDQEREQFGRGQEMEQFGRGQEREFGRGQERGGLGYDLRDRDRHLIGGVGGIYGSLGEYEKKYYYGRPREEDPFERLSRLAHERPRDEFGRFLAEGQQPRFREREFERRGRSRSREREEYYGDYRGAKSREGSERLSRLAQERPRDEQGRFLPEGEREEYRGKRERSRSRSRSRDRKNQVSEEGREKLSRLAQERPRDELGHFVSGEGEKQGRQDQEQQQQRGGQEKEQGARQRPSDEGTEKLSRLAQERPRDEQGKFLPEGENKERREGEEDKGKQSQGKNQGVSQKPSQITKEGEDDKRTGAEASQRAQERPRDDQGKFVPEGEAGSSQREGGDEESQRKGKNSNAKKQSSQQY